MKFARGQQVKVFFDGSWINGRYIERETGESEMLCFKNGRIVSQDTVKYERHHVRLANGLQYATSKRNIRAV